MKRLKIIVTIAIIVIIIAGFRISWGMQSYYKVDFSTGLVTASSLNVRCGPGTQYQVIATIKKGEYIRVFAGVGNWYVVQAEGDYVGVVSKQYVKPIYPSSASNTGSNSNNNNSKEEQKAQLSADEQEVFNLINQQRTNNGLSALKIDNEVQRIARVKAQDMVDNNYFSHTSPTYGSPFDMLNSFRVTYKTAGENISGNSSNSGAVNAWMNSQGHRENILNGSFNYTGIGVIKGSKYGKIYVQMFIQK